MDCDREVLNRVEWLKKVLTDTKAKGFVFGNSGGKDSALVGILLKLATDNVTGIIMPCESKSNYSTDITHASLVADKFNIKTITIDLTKTKKSLAKELNPYIANLNPMAYNNINPRLRMITLYSYAQSYGYLVAGTGNLSETMMGYFTKWGDGAYDINPIADLTAGEVFEMLRYLDCPKHIIDKAPSAGLYEGQTDEQEMGLTYKDIDTYLREGDCWCKEKIEEKIKATEHKRKMPLKYDD